MTGKIDRACRGCDATLAERERHQKEAGGSPDDLGFRYCRGCGGEKCCVCDMGDDVECGNCDDSDLD